MSCISVNPKIVEYVKYYSSQGYSVDRIRQFLIDNKIPQKDVDDAIYAVRNNPNQNISVNPGNVDSYTNHTNQNTQNAALEMQIRNYIQTQLNNGYNIEMIKNALIRQGYNPLTINNAANSLGNVNINVKHEVHVSKGTIIGIVAAIFIVGIIIFGVINISLFTPKESLLDISVSTEEYSYVSGETINYQVHISNMGSLRGFDATLKSLIIDDSGNIITRKEETLALETTASINRNIQIPSNTASGKYYLQIISDYGDKQAKSSTSFEIVNNESEKKPSTYYPNNTPQNTTDTKPSSSNANKPATTPAATPDTTHSSNSAAQNINIQTTSTDKIFGDVLTEAKNSAQSDPAYALSLCTKLASSEQKDICYSTVADNSQQYSYCEKISDVEYRDNCYLTFVMKGNVDICSKITDNSSRTFCDQLRIIQLMDRYYKENNTEKILELSKQFNPDIIQTNSPQVQTYEYTYSEPVTIMDIVYDENSYEDSANTTGLQNSTEQTDIEITENVATS